MAKKSRFDPAPNTRRLPIAYDLRSLKPGDGLAI